MTHSQQGGIEHIMATEARIPVPEAFAQQANVTAEQYREWYRESVESPDTFWDARARDFHWFTPYTQVLDWQPPFARWFVGGETNLSYNALDRHVEAGRGDKRALVWEGEGGDVREYSYAQLLEEVARTAAALTRLGVKKGDRVTIYLPMIPEATISMLACARIGAPHSVVFGGFAAGAVADRLMASGSEFVITADGGWRKGELVPLKPAVDEAARLAAAQGQPVRGVLVVQHAGQNIPMQPGRDHWWHEARGEDTQEAVPVDSEHPLFLLYTSGSTGKPKGILHTTGGYMVNVALTTHAIFDLKDSDLFWCTADVGWITGHSYSTYGPLLLGQSIFMYEGAHNHPDWGRFWDMVERHRITVLYTAPTAIRSFMRHGDETPAQYDLSSLRLLGSVGEPINPQAWHWYRRVIGGDRCPVVDTWWQTETGAVMLTTLPGVHAAEPGTAGVPMFGIVPAILNQQGEELPADEGGFLTIRQPWPSMLRTVYGDDERFRRSYYGEIEGVYFAGDGARRSEDGYVTVLGRVDDVLNVSGHRLSTAEVESALVAHPQVAEAAVVGRPDEMKGESIFAFVLPQEGETPDAAELRAYVSRQLGKVARPDHIVVAPALPKTRSGKIMRRFLRQIAAGRTIEGDTSTLDDPGVLKRLAETPVQ
ncbi:Acetyl-coenzyme A synthetase [Deinococcus proteolyticus MRP]|uniref:Acetyl-coenzyme A synthetase n=1 Tax=Deinococcus proteolyticus (strain ATCC 35074 / DSM 20540 / JCM 6276 / NBRC 101906 / NCIMB 13154 / VKM Ac-1939 / CCM 2703 / MRP) TaxID=693977 RepID=F0RK22_DEIPM|nr:MULTISPECIES: acetate--CoA ligase [Deinococcus]ADY26668.1 Acetyl-coenzyme A synthetase [Deinococcus proteolyticus MRP]MCY1702796.1 acetate--CoA ligase [Deinococcus sp. SL84]